MKRLAPFSLGLFVSVAAVFGQGSTQVNYSTPLNERTVYLNPTTPVAAGNSVWLGAFNSSFNVQANADNPAALLANWQQYDSTTIVNSLGPFPQQGSFIDRPTSTSPVFDGLRMHLWIFSTSNGQSPAGDFSNVNAYGLFTSNTDSDWIFPALGNPPSNTRDIYSSDAIQAIRGSIDSAHLYLGSFSPVPEPSAVALLSVGLPAAVLMLRKRRKD